MVRSLLAVALGLLLAGCVSDAETAAASACRVEGEMPAPESAALLSACERAVPVVLEVWPQWTGPGSGAPEVVIARADEPLPPGIAARVEGIARPGAPTRGDRLIVAPGLHDQLDDAGLEVVLRHELTHLAMRSTGSAPLPLWVIEGLAEQVAYEPVSDERRERRDELARLRDCVESGAWAGTMPADAHLDGSSAAADPSCSAYVAAWLAMDLLITDLGRPAVIAALQPEVDAETGADAEDRFLDRLGITRAELDARWRKALAAVD